MSESISTYLDSTIFGCHQLNPEDLEKYLVARLLNSTTLKKMFQSKFTKFYIQSFLRPFRCELRPLLQNIINLNQLNARSSAKAYTAQAPLIEQHQANTPSPVPQTLGKSLRPAQTGARDIEHPNRIVLAPYPYQNQNAGA